MDFFSNLGWPILKFTPKKHMHLITLSCLDKGTNVQMQYAKPFVWWKLRRTQRSSLPLKGWVFVQRRLGILQILVLLQPCKLFCDSCRRWEHVDEILLLLILNVCLVILGCTFRLLKHNPFLELLDSTLQPWVEMFLKDVPRVLPPVENFLAWSIYWYYTNLLTLHLSFIQQHSDRPYPDPYLTFKSSVMQCLHASYCFGRYQGHAFFVWLSSWEKYGNFLTISS